MKIIDLFSGIGNAVTVDIVELIAKRLKFIVDEFTPYTQEKLV